MHEQVFVVEENQGEGGRNPLAIVVYGGLLDLEKFIGRATFFL